MKTSEALSVFIVESLSSSDVYQDRFEGEAIVRILKLLNVKALYRKVIGKKELRRAINEAQKKKANVLHVSCHADKKGIVLTSMEQLTWLELAEITGEYLNKRVLCLSACEAGNHNVSKAFRVHGYIPKYIVGPESRVDFAQACVAWCVFYNYLEGHRISRVNMKTAMDRMNNAVDSDFLYRRWTGKRHLRCSQRR